MPSSRDKLLNRLAPTGVELIKRLFDIIMSGFGLALLSPLFLLLAILIKLDSPGPVFFRQERVGQFGKIFRIHKFRTMVSNADRLGLAITVATDQRITSIGAKLRKYKLDEIAQLLDVICGSMSLVGPRPEVPKYVAHYPEDLREIILSVKPGISDWASIKFKDENEILAHSANPQSAYINEILPIKVKYYVDYAKNHSLAGDIRIIFTTLFAIISR